MRKRADSTFELIDSTGDIKTPGEILCKVLSIMTMGNGNMPYVWMGIKNQLTTPRFASHPYNALETVFDHMSESVPSFWELIRALHYCKPEDLWATWERETEKFLEAYKGQPAYDRFKQMLSI